MIPGNEKRIGRMINSLNSRGATVLSADFLAIHTSGHGQQDELATLHEAANPEWLIPVHGEYHHLKSNVEIAKKCGVKKGLILKNGLLLKVSPVEPEVIGSIPSGRLMLDGKRIIPINEEASAVNPPA